MTSSGIRGIRRKKWSLSEVKIGVVGASGVGKTALVVRFLTKRFIGEYERQSEQRYRNEILVDNEPILFEILDTTASGYDVLSNSETLSWADGFMLVYSITDRKSFNWIKEIKHQLTERKIQNNSREKYACSGSSTPNLSPSPPPAIVDMPTNGTPFLLVGNKADLIHMRQVATEEGETLARDLECPFYEVAASEQVTQITGIFHELFHEVQNSRKRCKTSLLDRVLGTKTTKIYVRNKSDSALSKE